MERRAELVRSNYEQAQQRLNERRALLAFKRRELEGDDSDSQLAERRDEIRKLEELIAEDEQLLPVFERHLQKCRAEELYAVYAKWPAKLDALAVEHEALWTSILEALFGNGTSEAVAGLLKRLAALENEATKLHKEYAEARSEYEHGHLFADLRCGPAFPPVEGPEWPGIPMGGIPQRGSRAQFEWLFNHPAVRSRLRRAREERDDAPSRGIASSDRLGRAGQ